MIWAALLGGLSALQVVQGNRAVQEQANAQFRAQQEAQRANQALQQQKMQELKIQASMELTKESKARRVEAGKIIAKQADTGLVGATPMRNLADVYIQEALTSGTIISKEEAKLRTVGYESLADARRTTSAMNQIESKAAASMTSPLGALFKIGTSAAGGYMMGGGTIAGVSTSTAGLSGAELAAAQSTNFSRGMMISQMGQGVQ